MADMARDYNDLLHQQDRRRESERNMAAQILKRAAREMFRTLRRQGWTEAEIREHLAQLVESTAQEG